MIHSAFDELNDIFASYTGPEDPNYMDLGFANIDGNTPQDFDLVNAGSPAVDAGADIADNTLDYFNRTRPIGSAPDIGALEFGSAQIVCIPRFPVQSKGLFSELTRRIHPRFGPVRPEVHRRSSEDPQKWNKVR